MWPGLQKSTMYVSAKIANFCLFAASWYNNYYNKVFLTIAKAIANGLVGQVLAGPLFLKVCKSKISFYKK